MRAPRGAVTIVRSVPYCTRLTIPNDCGVIMGIIAFLILGLIVGAIARAIMKDRIAGGWLASLVIGVLGALVGGWIGTATGVGDVDEFFSISTWLLAILGAIIVLAIWGLITGRSRSTR